MRRSHDGEVQANEGDSDDSCSAGQTEVVLAAKQANRSRLKLGAKSTTANTAERVLA